MFKLLFMIFEVITLLGFKTDTYKLERRERTCQPNRIQSNKTRAQPEFNPGP